MRPIALFATLAALAAPLCAQFTLVAPNGYATVEGASNNIYPWNRGASSMHFLQLYDSSHFTAQGVNSPILIQRVRFRANATTATWAGGSWPNVQIDMSTAAVDYLAASSTYASNHGPDRATVLNGQVTVLPGTGNGAGVPGPWHVDITLTTPFRYDPTSGSDLAFDVALDGAGWSGQSATCDAVSGTTASPAPPVGSRVFNTTSHTATTGTVGLNHMLPTEFTYVPAQGLWPSFTATPTTGASPLTVNFTDNTYTSDPGGVLAWAWDFDNDTVIDSTVRNPSHTYTTCGTFSVSLTVIDAAHPPQTLTRSNLVRTDDVVPDFDWTLLAPNVVMFNDRSQPAATQWAWDLNGDNVVDSTAQNPVWVYPATCVAGPNVTLTVNRLCRGPFSITKPTYVANTLQGAIGGGTANRSATAVGHHFDVTVASPEGINICGLSVTPYSFTGPFQIEVYVTPDTYVGKDAAPAAWRLAATGAGTSPGGTSTTNPILVEVPLVRPVLLPQGSYGLAIYLVGSSVNYLVQSTGPLGPFGNADLTIYPSPGTAPGVGKTDRFAGVTSQNAIWNGRIHYSRCSVGGDAGYGFFGSGCTGAQGIPGNVAQTLPRLGTTLNIDFTRLPQNAGFMLLGFSRTMSAFGPLPLSLAPFGAPGCSVLVSGDASILLLGNNNTATWSLAIPLSPNLACVQFHTQALVLDPAANQFGAVVSDAASGVLGN